MDTYSGDDSTLQDAFIDGEWFRVPADLDVAALEDSDALIVRRFVVTLDSSRLR
jgi:hypothetical protein